MTVGDFKELKFKKIEHLLQIGENHIHRLIIYWGDKKGNNTEMASGDSEAFEIRHKKGNQVNCSRCSCSSSGWRIKTTVWVNSARPTWWCCRSFPSPEPPCGSTCGSSLPNKAH